MVQSLDTAEEIPPVPQFIGSLAYETSSTCLPSQVQGRRELEVYQNTFELNNATIGINILPYCLSSTNARNISVRLEIKTVSCASKGFIREARKLGFFITKMELHVQPEGRNDLVPEIQNLDNFKVEKFEVTRKRLGGGSVGFSKCIFFSRNFGNEVSETYLQHAAKLESLEKGGFGWKLAYWKVSKFWQPFRQPTWLSANALHLQLPSEMNKEGAVLHLSKDGDTYPELVWTISSGSLKFRVEIKLCMARVEKKWKWYCLWKNDGAFAQLGLLSVLEY